MIKSLDEYDWGKSNVATLGYELEKDEDMSIIDVKGKYMIGGFNYQGYIND